MAYTLRSSTKKGQALPSETEDLNDSFLEVAATPPIIGAELERTQEIDEDHEQWICHRCTVDLEAYGSIGCDVCLLWFHGKCIGISDQQLEILTKDDATWVCPTCPKSSYNGYNQPSVLSQYLTDERNQVDASVEIAPDNDPSNIPICLAEANIPPIGSSPESNDPESSCHLPVFDKHKDITTTSWGTLAGEQISTKCNQAYNEIVKWKRNLFLLPSGKTVHRRNEQGSF